MAREGRTTLGVLALAALALLTAAAPVARKTPLTAAQRATMFWQEFSWSPDGRHMLLTGMPNGRRPALYLAKANGTGAIPLTDTLQSCSWGAWSPDGLHIAYACRVDTADAIFVMNVDGSGARRVTDGSAPSTAPDWSPDGSRLVFLSGRSGTSAVWTIGVDGQSPTMLCDATGDESSPVWSPDGQKIAFYTSGATGSDSIVVVNADGSRPRNLGRGIWPHWSPHGDQIAFCDGPDGKPHDVWVMNADGSGRTRVGGPGFFARWSPNGRDVVYLRSAGSGWPKPSFIYSVRPGSGRDRRWPDR